MLTLVLLVTAQDSAAYIWYIAYIKPECVDSVTCLEMSEATPTHRMFDKWTFVCPEQGGTAGALHPCHII